MHALSLSLSLSLSPWTSASHSSLHLSNGTLSLVSAYASHTLFFSNFFSEKKTARPLPWWCDVNLRSPSLTHTLDTPALYLPHLVKYVYICVYICMYMCIYVYVYVYVSTLSHTHTHTHTHTWATMPALYLPLHVTTSLGLLNSRAFFSFSPCNHFINK